MLSNLKTQRAFFSTSLHKVVLLGSGFACTRVWRDLVKAKTPVDIQIVSPRNHHLFTPLLPSAATGTVEVR